MDRDQVLSLLRACLVSSKGGVSLNGLSSDFRNLAGCFIPYKKFGFPTLEDFLQDFSDDIAISRNASGDFIVQAKPNEKSGHLQKLVQMQKSSSKANKSSCRNYQSPLVRRLYGQQGNNTYMKPPRFSVPNNNYSRSNTSTNSSIQQNTLKKFNYSSSSSTSQDQQFGQQETNTQNPNSSEKSNSYHNFTINIQTSTPSNGNWFRWVNPSLAPLHTSNGLKSPPLPPSPPSPVSPQPIPGEVEIEKAIYPPAFDFKRNQGTPVPLSVNRESSTSKLTTQQTHHKTPQSVTTTYSVNPQASSYVQKLYEYATEHGLKSPSFKTIRIHEDKKVVYLSRVEVEQYVAFDPTIRKNSKKEAEELAAKLMLLKIPDLLKTNPISMPTTKDKQLIAARIGELTGKYPNGVWASEIPGEYRKCYSECLCENWLALVEGNDMYEVTKWDNNKIIVQQALDVKVNPLVPPPSPTPWAVKITNVVSSEEVWLCIEGNGYSDELSKLTNEMNTAKETLKFGLKQVHIGKYVLVQLETEVHRAQVLNWKEGSDQAVCILPDLGKQKNILLADMTCLPERFIRLPFQAMKCTLKNLTVFREHADVNKYLEYKLMDETLIAICAHTAEGERVIELYDTSTEEDINVNNELCENIVTQLLPPSLPQGMDVIEVSVSCVLKSCEIFIQPRPVVVQYIENILQDFSTEILSQAPFHYFDTSNMYVTFCPDFSHMGQGDIPVATQQSGQLARVIIKKSLKFLPSNQENTDVYFVDYGWSGLVKSSTLKKLKTHNNLKDLLKIPHQAILCKLRGVPPEPNLLVKESAMNRLKDLVPPRKQVAMRTCKSESESYGAPPVIELFSRTQPENLVCSINDTIAMDLTLFEDS